MMKLFLACVAVALLTPEVELARYSSHKNVNVQDRFEEANITSDLIPKEALKCFYGETEITAGIYLSPEDTCGQLSIEYDGYESGCCYTVIILDIDFNPKNNCGSSMILLYIVNVFDISNYFDSGVTLASYCPPLFATVTERKRIVILVIKQTNKIDSSNCIENSYDKQRYQFDFASCASNNNLGVIIAGTYYWTSLNDKYWG